MEMQLRKEKQRIAIFIFVTLLFSSLLPILNNSLAHKNQQLPSKIPNIDPLKPRENVVTQTGNDINWNVGIEDSNEKIIVKALVGTDDEIETIEEQFIILRVGISRLTERREEWVVIESLEETSTISAEFTSRQFNFEYTPLGLGVYKIDVFLFVGATQDPYLSDLANYWNNFNFQSSLKLTDNNNDDFLDSIQIENEVEEVDYEFIYKLKVTQQENDVDLDSWLLLEKYSGSRSEFSNKFHALNDGNYKVKQIISVGIIDHPELSTDEGQIILERQDFGISELIKTEGFIEGEGEIRIADHSIGDGVPNCQDEFVFDYDIQYALNYDIKLDVTFTIKTLDRSRQTSRAETIEGINIESYGNVGNTRQGYQKLSIGIRSDRDNFPGNVQDMVFYLEIKDLISGAIITLNKTLSYDIEMCGPDEFRGNGVRSYSSSNLLILFSLLLLVLARGRSKR